MSPIVANLLHGMRTTIHTLKTHLGLPAHWNVSLIIWDDSGDVFVSAGCKDHELLAEHILRVNADPNAERYKGNQPLPVEDKTLN